MSSSLGLVPSVVHLPEDRLRPDRAAPGLAEDETVFLFMFDFLSHVRRKNPEAVVEAFCAAFPAGEEKVRLLIKTQGGEHAPEDWRRLGDLCLDPRIEIRDAKIDRAEVIALIEAADAFVSLHRAEGFGRGPAEAMWLGKPVISTDYSGTSDFADHETAFLVGYQRVPVAVEDYPGAEGQDWADPDVEEAARAMRRIHTHPEAARAIGARGQTRVRSLYHPRIAGEAMRVALGLVPPAAAPPALPPRRRARPRPALAKPAADLG